MEIINNVRIFERKPLVYGVTLDDNSDRLDCTWFNPELNKKINDIDKKLKGQKSIPLNKISYVTGGKRLPKGTVIRDDENNYIPYIRGVDVKNLKIDLINCQKISKDIHKEIQNYQLIKNDIVVSIVGTIGEIGFLDEEVEVCDFTENIAKVRIHDENIMHNYVLHYLDSDLAKIQFEKYMVGSLQYKLSLNSLRKNIKLVVPYENNNYLIDKQNKILEKVNYHLQEAEELKKKSRNKIEEANNLILKEINIKLPTFKETEIYKINLSESSNRLDALFNNPQRETLRENIKKFGDYKPLSKLIEFEKDNKVITSDFYKLVELSDIDENLGKIVKYNEVPMLGSEKVLFKKDTILISKLQPETGKIVIVNKDFEGCVGSSELVPIRLKSEEILLKYLWIVLRSNYVLKQWAYSLTGSSRMRIGKNEIKDTLIPLPNKQKQEEIVNKVFELFEEANNYENKSIEQKLLAKKEFTDLILNP